MEQLKIEIDTDVQKWKLQSEVRIRESETKKMAQILKLTKFNMKQKS